MGQLGYPTPPEEIPHRLAALKDDDKTSISWIAELDGRVVGFAGARVFPAIHQQNPIAQLTILVVDKGVRGQGIGRQLVELGERWARERGAWRISLTSALHRDDAHKFYERLGYEHTGVRLVKTL